MVGINSSEHTRHGGHTKGVEAGFNDGAGHLKAAVASCADHRGIVAAGDRKHQRWTQRGGEAIGDLNAVKVVVDALASGKGLAGSGAVVEGVSHNAGGRGEAGAAVAAGLGVRAGTGIAPAVAGEVGRVIAGGAIHITLAEGDGGAGDTSCAVVGATGFLQGGAGAGGNNAGCIVTAVNRDDEVLICRGPHTVGDTQGVGQGDQLPCSQVVKCFRAGVKSPVQTAAGLGARNHNCGADAEHVQQQRIAETADAAETARVAPAGDRELGSHRSVGDVNVADAERAAGREGAVGFAQHPGDAGGTGLDADIVNPPGFIAGGLIEG